jgi:hypothetical protein
VEVIIYQALVIDPLNQARKDWPSLVDCFDSAGSTDGTANNSHTFNTLLLLLGWHQATTIRTCGVPTLMFFAIHCAPVIYQVFLNEWLATVGAAGGYPLAKAFRVIRHALVHIKTSTAYGFMAGSAKEVLWVPGCSQSIDITSPDGLITLFADRL